MYDYAKPTLTGTESSIVTPAVAKNNFELKPSTFQMIQQFVQFDGLQDGDPNNHLANFLEFYDTFKINGVSDDMDLETLYDAWERYKDLLRRCPHHGLPLWLQVQTFYNGVNPSTRQLIDVAAGDTLKKKTPEAAYEFIEEMSLNNYQWKVIRTKPTKAVGVFNLDAVTMLSNQVELLKTHFQNIETVLKNQQASIQGLENQIGQLAKLMSERPQGSLPSNPETNPKEQLHTIIAHDSEELDEPNPRQENIVDKGKVEMPNSTKFLKELLSNKRKLDDTSHVELNAVHSTILQNKLPRKLKDPGSFTILCLIGGLSVNNALADLGASINVMPYKIFKQLGLGKPKQTRMSIQLADKTIRFPRGIIEYVLVKIDKFIFPVDFVVLDMDEDSDVPLILGRPFLATAKTRIDVGTCELTLRVRDKTITLQAHDSVRTSSNKVEYINYINNHLVQTSFQEAPRQYTTEPHPRSLASNEVTHEERRLQIDKLDEWRIHSKEKPRIHEGEPKQSHDEPKNKMIQFKVGDRVLMDNTDPRIATSEPNGTTSFTVLNIFPYGTVEVTHSRFGTFKAWEKRTKYHTAVRHGRVTKHA
ncbi:Retrovirus-related Pol polyprotein from transposon 17.6 [Gossypium australe]|uniref:Retrovirus-related Pol polyprotein from transposon 17.6 n=1 Tax=Gossypium australe TaxID=47621 RepID=A0A5B6WQI9_9ROSI|nr:Retrovirus-related Pol polyprotein from transposon 17.6 [Gossypium australe]